MGIRNGLGLWGQNEKLIEDCRQRGAYEADDASTIIIKGVWEALQNKD